jgi:hypothetical protein
MYLARMRWTRWHLTRFPLAPSLAQRPIRLTWACKRGEGPICYAWALECLGCATGAISAPPVPHSPWAFAAFSTALDPAAVNP